MTAELGATQASDVVRDLAASALAASMATADAESLPVRLLGLMVDIAAGDERAFGCLYDATARRVYAVALRMLGNPCLAEEIALDVYMQAWRSADRYDPTRAPVLTWLMMICRSRALDALRAQGGPPVEGDCDDFPGGEPGADEPFRHVESSEQQRSLRVALQGLAPVERQVIALAFYRGMSHAEMAAHIGMPLGTVKTHVRRALGKMRAAIEAHHHRGET